MQGHSITYVRQYEIETQLCVIIQSFYSVQIIYITLTIDCSSYSTRMEEPLFKVDEYYGLILFHFKSDLKATVMLYALTQSLT